MKSFISIIAIALASFFTGGCTSIGHEERTEPQIEVSLAATPSIVAISGSGELSIAIELLLASRGVEVLLSPLQIDQKSTVPKGKPVRYAITATSVDLDMCIPEGSRQMHFHISVVDLMENKRVYAMSGDYGCKDTIVRTFEKWLFK
jgi:hypothetical protein